MASSSSSAAAAAPPSCTAADDSFLTEEPDYDFSFLDDDDDLKKPTKNQQYILGTLIVRVVAARDLEAVAGGGGAIGKLLSSPSRSGRRLGEGTANPYASVKFCGQTQRTSEVYDTTNPTWPHHETMFLDVTLPTTKVLHESPNKSTSTHAAAAAASLDEQDSTEEIPKPILNLAIFHAMPSSGNSERYPTKKKAVTGDSDEPFLGMASLDVTPLLTGKIPTIDKWLSLTGTAADDSPRGTVRLVVEYEASDAPPRPGDLVRFTTFCALRDLYPIPPCQAHAVEEVDGDNILLTYITPEGWHCTFQAHRYMVICQERHAGKLELAHEELASLAERLGKSPLVNVVQETVERVPDDGLLNVGAEAVRGGASLLERWLKGGVETAAQDLAYATNWNGQAVTTATNNSVASIDIQDTTRPAVAPPLSESTTQAIGRLKVPDDYDSDEDEGEALPGMPSCPITGEPMVNPVVAADGHTYERSAIARWFLESDKSPLTGAYLAHKELVPNYVLLSSLEQSVRKSDSGDE